MKVCPKCRAAYDDPEESFCSVDGIRLVLEEELEAAGDDPMLGRTIADRFTIIGVIGAGGMGSVYKAIQAPIDRVVALKVLRTELASDPELVTRFRREAKAASMLKSPHTVTLHDFGQDSDGTLFLAMELLEGESLASRLKSRQLSWKKALKIAVQVAESLAEAHERGIVHRDLKPDNVVLVPTVGGKEHAKVLDFGIARLTRKEEGPDTALTLTGAVFGTPAYMSPEQALGEKADSRTDLYSFGVVLFEMLAGRLPFRAKKAVLMMGKHISAPPPTLRQVCDQDVPGSVEAVVLSLLEKDPNDRIQTAEELIEALSETLTGQFPQAGLHFDPVGKAVGQRASASSSELPAFVSGAGEGPSFTPAEKPEKAQVSSQADTEIDPLPEKTEDKRPLATSRDTVPPIVASPTTRPKIQGRPWLVPALGITVVAGLALAVLPTMFWPDGELQPPVTEPPTPQQNVAANVPEAPSHGGNVRKVGFELDVHPRDAAIHLGGVALGENPYKTLFPFSRDTKRLLITAEGYKTDERVLTFDQPHHIKINLEKAEAFEPPQKKLPVSNGTQRKSQPVAEEAATKTKSGKQRTIIKDVPWDNEDQAP